MTEDKGFLLDDSHLKGNVFGGLITNGTTTPSATEGKNGGKKRLPKQSNPKVPKK